MQILKTIVLVIFLMSTILSCTNSGQPNDKTIAEASQTKLNTSFNLELFFQAALDGDITIIENALKNNVNVNSTDNENRTALMLSAFNGHLTIVKLLIENGADVNILDATNRTALMYGSTGPFNPVVEELLKAGSNPNIADNIESWTALMFAAGEGQLKVVTTLVENGADLNMIDKDGETAYDFAISKGHPEVASYIKSKI